MIFTTENTGGSLFSTLEGGGIYEWTTIFKSGKHSGKSVLAICVDDIEYLRWMMNNGAIFAPNISRAIKSTKEKPRVYNYNSNRNYDNK